VESEEIDLAVDAVEVEATPQSRGTARKAKPVDARTTKKMKGRTIYLPDDLFERILVQAHRRNRTISEYVTGILERQVPDHRVVRAETAEV
jgi:hypothetical protein